MFEDKTLVCKDCGKEFVWTAGEQEFYASRGFENQPQRCKACRDARKNAVRGERQMFDAVCASCGKACKVPFQPREDRPVYCRRVLRQDEAELRNLPPPPGPSPGGGFVWENQKGRGMPASHGTLRRRKRLLKKAPRPSARGATASKPRL